MQTFGLTDQPLDPQALGAALRDAHCGAFVSFEGWVRDHHHGRAVRALSYTAYPALALAEGRRIIAEALTQHDIDQALCMHRVGDLQVGDCAVWVGVSAAHRAAAFDACRDIIDTIKACVPIWKHEHYADGESAWVGCNGCHASAPQASLDARYGRQIALPDLGAAGQRRLSRAHVLVVGLGALGCPAARYLAGAGVGHMTLLDGDTVAAHNLHRQTLYTESDIGQPKALAAARALQAANSDIHIDAHATMADGALLKKLLRDVDLVLDCTDNPACKQLLSTLARQAGVPWSVAGVQRMAGGLYVSPDTPEDGVCWNCISGSSDDDCSTAGVLGPVPGTLGALQAAAALQALTGMQSGFAGHWTCLDLAAGQFERFRTARRADCDCAVPESATTATLSRDQVWVDLRTQAERDDDPLDGSIAVAPSQLENWIRSQPDVPGGYVLLCARGVRSQVAVQRLRAGGRSDVQALAGGLAAIRREQTA